MTVLFSFFFPLSLSLQTNIVTTHKELKNFIAKTKLQHNENREKKVVRKKSERLLEYFTVQKRGEGEREREREKTSQEHYWNKCEKRKGGNTLGKKQLSGMSIREKRKYKRGGRLFNNSS